MAFKPPANFRATASRTPVPEALTVVGGIGILSEAPADPAMIATPMSVVMGGSPYTRTTGTPGVGQYRVKTQTVIGSDGGTYYEYLPLVEFHASAEGLSGTADYYRAGTVWTAEWLGTLIAFLTPLTQVVSPESLNSLYPPTMDPYTRGRPGDVAFLVDGTMYYSDGSLWTQASGTGAAMIGGGLTVAATIAAALDAGYVGPSFATDDSFGKSLAVSQDALWEPPGQFLVDVPAMSKMLALSMDAVVAQVGAPGSYAKTISLAQDALFAAAAAYYGDPTAYASAISLALDAAWSSVTNAIADPGTTSSPVTFTGTANTGTGQTAELWDGASAIRSVEAYADTTNAAPVTAPSLTTGSGASLLVACVACSAGDGNGGWSPAISSSPSLTWTQRASVSGSTTGSAIIWTATPAASTAYTVSFDNGITFQNAKYLVVVEASTSGALGAAINTSGTASLPAGSITPQAAGSLLLTVGIDRQDLQFPSTFTGTLLQSDSTGYGFFVVAQDAANTSATSVGAATGSNATSWAVASLEVKE